MPKVHIKGYILQLIARNESIWDDEIASAVLAEYGLSGDYWRGTVRLSLADMFSGGLLDELDTRVDVDGANGAPTLRFKFAVNSFGAERMAQTGLSEVSR